MVLGVQICKHSRIGLSQIAIKKHRRETLSHTQTSGPSCLKLMMSLVNISLKFQMLISEICQFFLLKHCEKFLHCKSFSHVFNKKYQCTCIW